jgi:hypothetical protein
VVIMDAGAQTPRGFQIHGQSDIESAVRTVLAPLSGRRLSPTEVGQLLKKVGLESLRRAVHEPGAPR